jgi:hypothetical protein
VVFVSFQIQDLQAATGQGVSSNEEFKEIDPKLWPRISERHFRWEATKAQPLFCLVTRTAESTLSPGPGVKIAPRVITYFQLLDKHQRVQKEYALGSTQISKSADGRDIEKEYTVAFNANAKYFALGELNKETNPVSPTKRSVRYTFHNIISVYDENCRIIFQKKNVDYRPVYLSGDVLEVLCVKDREQEEGDAYDDQNAKLILLNNSGSEIKVIESPELGGPFMISPNGKWLHYSSVDPSNKSDARFKLMNLETGRIFGYNYNFFSRFHAAEPELAEISNDGNLVYYLETHKLTSDKKGDLGRNKVFQLRFSPQFSKYCKELKKP